MTATGFDLIFGAVTGILNGLDSPAEFLLTICKVPFLPANLEFTANSKLALFPLITPGIGFCFVIPNSGAYSIAEETPKGTSTVRLMKFKFTVTEGSFGIAGFVMITLGVLTLVKAGDKLSEPIKFVSSR